MILHPLLAPGCHHHLFLKLVVVRDWCKIMLMVVIVVAMVKSTIMAVQAVLEIHIERNMEQAMNPSMISAGLVPTKLKIARAILVQNVSSSDYDDDYGDYEDYDDDGDGEPVVEAAVLDGDGHHEAGHEHHVRRPEVVHAHLKKYKIQKYIKRKNTQIKASNYHISGHKYHVVCPGIPR